MFSVSHPYLILIISSFPTVGYRPFGIRADRPLADLSHLGWAPIIGGKTLQTSSVTREASLLGKEPTPRLRGPASGVMPAAHAIPQALSLRCALPQHGREEKRNLKIGLKYHS